MPELSDFLNSINKTKYNLFKNDEVDPGAVEKDFKKLTFIVNRILSYFPDSIFYAQEMNMRPFLDGRLQYEYLLAAVQKRSRFAKGIKVTNPEHLELVKKYYTYSTKKAREALDVLTEQDIQYIKDRLYEGGVKKKNA